MNIVKPKKITSDVRIKKIHGKNEYPELSQGESDEIYANIKNHKHKQEFKSRIKKAKARRHEKLKKVKNG